MFTYNVISEQRKSDVLKYNCFLPFLLLNKLLIWHDWDSIRQVIRSSEIRKKYITSRDIHHLPMQYWWQTNAIMIMKHCNMHWKCIYIWSFPDASYFTLVILLRSCSPICLHNTTKCTCWLWKKQYFYNISSYFFIIITTTATTATSTATAILLLLLLL